jgi:hypothetical protein
MPLFKNSNEDVQSLTNEAQQNAIAYTDKRIAELLEAVYPSFHTHWWGTGKIISGQPFTTALGAAYQFSRATYQNPSAATDEIQFEALLAAGNYRLDFLATKTTNRGIVSFFLGETLIGSPVNLYSSTTINNFTISMSFFIPKGGLQIFKAKVTGKQSESTGYFVAAAVIFISRI